MLIGCVGGFMILIPLLVVLDDRCVWSVGVETWSVGRASESVGRWSVVVGGSEVQQLLLVPARTVPGTARF